MLNNQEKIERLKMIAVRLSGGWVYHALLSENARDAVLSNKSGLYLKIGSVYGKNIAQWKLCIKDEKYHSYFQVISSIGCNLEKSIGAIVGDINSRLLCHATKANEKIKTGSNEKIKKDNLIAQRKMVIHSIDKMISIEANKNHGYQSYNILDDEENKIGSFEHIHERPDNFNFHLSGVTAENIIKIMILMKG